MHAAGARCMLQSLDPDAIELIQVVHTRVQMLHRPKTKLVYTDVCTPHTRHLFFFFVAQSAHFIKSSLLWHSP